MKGMLGAQMFTVRAFTQTADDFAAAVRRVAGIGYRAVQLSGHGPIPVAHLARACADAGVKVAATHVKWERFLTDADAVMEEHRTLGCVHAAIGGLPAAYRGADGVRRFVAELGPVSERLRKAGMDFSYHNHSWEFARADGRTWLDLLYAAASPDVLKAELDTYWIQHGGGDPAAWVARCGGREPLLHLKDMAIGADGQQCFAEVGEGNLNWPGILAAAEKGGVEHFLVEQDQCYERDPFDSLAISYRNLSAMGLR